MRRLRLRETMIQRAVVDHWRALGLPGTLVAAVPNAGALGQPGLTAGVFDLICIGPQILGRVGFIELKTDDGTLSEAQKAFLKILQDNDVTYAVAYGREEPIQVLELWGLVRPRAKLLDTTKRRETRMLK
jgi:hypothetical protein